MAEPVREHRSLAGNSLHGDRRSIDFRDYAPASANDTDDSGKLRTAIADADNVGWPLYLGPHQYWLGSGVTIPRHVEIRGCYGRTELLALDGFGATVIDGDEYHALAIPVGQCRVSDVTFDGRDVATDAVICRAAARSEFARCRFERAVRDGFRLPAPNSTRNNNQIRLRDCIAWANGAIYGTGSLLSVFAGMTIVGGRTVDVGVTASVADRVVTFSGSVESTGIRMGTPIALGDSPRTQGVVVSVDSPTQVTTELVDQAFAGSGLTWACGVGDGFSIGAENDANNTFFESCESGYNRGWQLAASGFYGPRVNQLQMIGAPWGCAFAGMSRAGWRFGLDVSSAYCGDGVGFDETQTDWTFLGVANVRIHQTISANPSRLYRALAGTQGGTLLYNGTTHDIGSPQP